MSIKILGGIAKGFPLETPKSDLTRPTSVLLRRKLFDWRQSLEDFIFVDLCAGSGGVGYESLSRGAQRVFLNEMMRGAFLTLKQNKLKFQEAFQLDPSLVKLTNLDARAWVKKEMPYELPETAGVILFFDPPYENHALYQEVLTLLREQNFQGELWLESDRLKGPEVSSLTGVFHSIIKIVEQGDHFVVVGKLG
jgi:16S rRNA (guanine966-N2)-methyltransferase